MHPSSGWRAGGLIGLRGSAPADPERFAAIMRVPSCPRASSWDPVWVWHHQMGPTNIWLAELLASQMRLRPGMRVLDMGCGAAATSLFLALEYDIEVWAADLWIDPTDNLARIREAGLDQRVHPLRVDAAALPFADGWFDALFSVDAYHYFGMSPDFLASYAAMVKPGGEIGIVVPGTARTLQRGSRFVARTGGVRFGSAVAWSMSTWRTKSPTVASCGSGSWPRTPRGQEAANSWTSRTASTCFPSMGRPSASPVSSLLAGATNRSKRPSGPPEQAQRRGAGCWVLGILGRRPGRACGAQD